MSNVTRYRVAYVSGVWCVDIGREFKGWAGVRWIWDGYQSTDDGASWSSGGWLLHPEDEMKTIDQLLGVIDAHLRAAGLTEEADRNKKRQEAYWERMRWIREQAEAAKHGREARGR